MTAHEFITKWQNKLPQTFRSEFELDFVGLDKPASQPKPLPVNPIAEAHDKGERIRHKNWDKGAWIKKFSDTQAKDDKGNLINSVWMLNFWKKPEEWELYTEIQPDAETQAKIEGIERHIEKHAKPRVYECPERQMPKMTEKEKIQYILENKLTWKPMGNNRFYANWFSEEISGGGRGVRFVDYNNPISGYFETRIFTIDLSEWQPVVTAQSPKFDKERFERLFLVVLADMKDATWERAIEATQEGLNKLDAYYASKKEGNNE